MSDVRQFAACIVASSLALAGCIAERPYPSRPITLVCPWAAGGGTDRVSRQIAMHLEAELGVPVHVINATGGKGVTGHARGLRARPDGYTITMITLELNMLHWSGLTRLTYRDCQPLMSVNEDYAALLVRSDAPWRSLAELEQAIRDEPGRLTASGTASGGAWHLALAGWLISAGMQATDVRWVSSEGAGPSLQELISGGLDMVCCSLPEARSLLDAGLVRSLGVMAPERAVGFEQIPTFREQGRDWTLGGWRGLAVPKGTPPDRVQKLVGVLRRIVTGRTRVLVGYDVQDGRRVARWQTFPEFMQAERFNNRWREPDEFARFLAETDEKLGRLMTSPEMRSVNTEPLDPMLLPKLLMSMMAVIGGLLSWQGWSGRGRAARCELGSDAGRGGESVARLDRFAIVVAGTIFYIAAAEWLGFVLAGAMLLLALCRSLGGSWRLAVVLAVAVPPLAYQLFAHALRVPLPQGLLGW